MPDHLPHRLRTRVITLAIVSAVAAASAQAQTIGVLGITSEIGPIEKRLRDWREETVQGIVFRVGTLNDRPVVVARSGAGKVNAAVVTTILIGRFNPSALFFSGTAGAIDPALDLGDVVIGTSVAQHDVGQIAPDGFKRRGLRNAVTGALDPLLIPAPETLVAAARLAARALTLPRVQIGGSDRTPRIVEGVIVTGDVFVADSVRRDELRKSLGAAAVEMEGAAVAQVCRQFGRACLVVRSITDRADAGAMVSYDALRALASENAATLVAAVIGALPAR
jgi:adenosylhomocysteine nucleosidase